eukprot:1275133-Amphidinium_carterae.1
MLGALDTEVAGINLEICPCLLLGKDEDVIVRNVSFSAFMKVAGSNQEQAAGILEASSSSPHS